MPTIRVPEECEAEIEALSSADIKVRLYVLYLRWLSGRKHADFGDFAKEMKEMLPEGFRITQVNRRPFGMTTLTPSGNSLQISVTRKEFGIDIFLPKPDDPLTCIDEVERKALTGK